MLCCKTKTPEEEPSLPYLPPPPGRPRLPQNFAPVSSRKLEETTLLIVGGWNCDPKQNRDEAGKAIFAYTPIKKVWRKVGELPEPRHLHAAVNFMGCIYVIGGSYPVDTYERYPIALGTVFRWKLPEKKWSVVESMQKRRLQHGVAVLNNKIFVMGGEDENGSVLDSAEIYNPALDTWQNIAPLQQARIGMAVSAYNGMVLTAGGYTQGCTTTRGDYVVSTVEAYNPEVGNWMVLRKLPAPRFHGSLVPYKEDVYMIGGATCTNTDGNDGKVTSIGDVLKFNSASELWEHVVRLKYNRHGSAVTIIGKYVFIICGVSSANEAAVDKIERLDLETGLSVISPIGGLKAQLGMAVVVCDTKVFQGDGYLTPEKSETQTELNL